MSRSIRQGCLFSALLYLSLGENLALNPNINCITVNSNEIKSIQHAYDLTLTVRDISFINTNGNVLIFFLNWLKSGFLFVKDILDDNGSIRTYASFTNVIKNKSNWLCEYKIIISVFKSVLRK